MKIVILGAGPAGLMAAHAAVGQGHDVKIASRKRKSHLNGAQYLHSPIPVIGERIGGEGVDVHYTLQGTPLDYRLKVYGPNWDGTVSAEDLEEDHRAWDIRETYDWLWDRYSWAIEDFEIIPATIPTLQSLGADLIISSIPAPVLCVRGHSFGSVGAWAAGEAPGLGIRIPYDCAENTVVCCGDDRASWYRLSNVYGHKTIEWPDSLRKPPIQTVTRIEKPTFNNCDCWSEVLRVGRYGRWTKGVLAHHAYSDTLQALESFALTGQG